MFVIICGNTPRELMQIISVIKYWQRKQSPEILTSGHRKMEGWTKDPPVLGSNAKPCSSFTFDIRVCQCAGR